MKRNLMLMAAVALALGTAGARAAQNADECAQSATQLKMQIEQSNLSDPDRAKLESSLNEAQSADLARCEQIVARVQREIGASADSTHTDDYGAAASRETATAAGAAAGTTEASPSSTTGMPSGSDQSPATTDRATGLSGSSSESAATDRKPTTGTSKTGSSTAGSSGATGTGYEPGHATAQETLPNQPGANQNTEAADTTMKDEGYASPEATTEGGAAGPDDDMSAKMPEANDATGANGAQTAPVNPGAASTTMQTMDEVANRPNPSADKLRAMTSDELVDKPVKDANGEDVGEINAIVVDRNATPHAYAVVEYGGVLGIGEKHALVDLDKLELTADGSVRVPATDEDALSAYPRYEEKLYQKYEGDLGRLLPSG
jgi:hypothetical protein